MKKVTLTIEKKEYDVNLKDEIAQEINEIIKNDFKEADNISIKELLFAYIKNSLDKRYLEKELKSLHNKINGL
ncbi:MAG: hypothetical protein QG565_3 [Campylobacterota bacterium]|nr:hypothetical protein [Campylobacterota bacterium]